MGTSSQPERQAAPGPDFAGQLFAALPALYLLVDLDFRIIDATERYVRACRIPRQSLLGHNVFEVFPDNPDDEKASGVRTLRASLERVRSTARPDLMRVQRYDIRLDDGVTFEERYWRNFNTPILGSDGSLQAILHCVEDMTALVKLERTVEANGVTAQAPPPQARNNEDDLALHMRELAEARTRYDLARALFRDAADALILGTADGRFTDVNDAACRLYRRSREEFLRLAIADLLVETELHRISPLLAKISRGETDLSVWEQRRGDGSTFFAEMGTSMLPDGRWHAAIRDVTERQRASTGLADAVSRLEQEREVRERLVSAISHDLRTPITAARLSAEAILRHPDDPEGVTRTAGRIARSMDRADRMIRDLLDASRLRAGEGLSLELAEVDFAKIIAQAAEELATVHGPLFQVTTRGETRGVWDGDALRRVVENLAGNAAKYGLAQHPIAVDLDASDAETVTLRIHNDGEPIPAAQQAQLFKPFSRSKAAAAQGKPGWGIGLAIVRGLVEGHGGRVTVESVDGQGTTFQVQLPRQARRQGP